MFMEKSGTKFDKLLGKILLFSQKYGMKRGYYRLGLSSAFGDLFESPRTSSERPGKGPGAQAEGRHMSPCQHPGER